MLREVAAELERRGVPTPAVYAWAGDSPKSRCYEGKTSPWNACKVRGIVTREVYAGVLVGGATRSTAIGRGSARRATAPSERVRVEDAHEPIVSRELFDAAQAALRKK